MTTVHNSTDCPVCRLTDTAVLIETPPVPVYCNVLWPTHADALAAPTGEMRLCWCRECGHFFNAAFRPELMGGYDQQYENSLHYSEKFRSYAQGLAKRLVERYDLRDKHVVDIGCGKGDFLLLLCAMGHNRGIGYDHSYEEREIDPALKSRVRFIRDFYPARHPQNTADFICCRQVLEHLQHPVAFLQEIRKGIDGKKDMVVFFEVPNVMYTLKDLGIWDLIYEHYSYFSAHSLARAFTSAGFRVASLEDAFAGQYLTIEALPVTDTATADENGGAGEIQEINSYVEVFAEKYHEKVASWSRQLAEMKRLGKKVVVWGGGSKGIMFLNLMRSDAAISYVVDLNRHKHGRFVPVTGQEVVPPEFLKDYRPDAVITMNPIYREEIANKLQSMNVTAECVAA
ncbi:MAG TPA: class I SAM-dependent methyltransferase [Verrucomicrobiae bacterium]|nr:class I SAM-dependent methyltransferase [Verrucomicrobiae bacterium]